MSGLASHFTHLPGVLPVLPRPQPDFHPILSHYKTKQNTQTIGSPASEELLGVRVPGRLLFSCPVSCWGLRAEGCSWTPRLPEDLQPETLTSAGRGSWGSIPDLQTQAAHWPRAHDNHFLPGCLPSCSRGSSQGGGPAPEPEAVQEGRHCPW